MQVPATESSGRVHTSTATVAIMPEVDDVEVTIDPKVQNLMSLQAFRGHQRLCTFACRDMVSCWQELLH